MFKIVLIILCVLIFIGMLSLDAIISKSIDGSEKKEEENSKDSGIK